MNFYLVQCLKSQPFILSFTSYLSDGALSYKRKIKKNKALFDELLNAMDTVGFLDEEQQDMFIVLSGILNLGNVVFEMDENEGAFVKDTQGALAIASVSYY
ncbi:PREDICTED: myosin-1-like [Acropora digitifera]|uniref:myosin-1-like n=1 Tax=Acropora digitifera TaxID=70779 RepID=UPI00077AE9D6|nr:PREDICTED: myosin-1-like [Acropora digitifera]